MPNISSIPYWQQQASGSINEAPGLEMLFGGGAGGKLAMSAIGGALGKGGIKKITDSYLKQKGLNAHKIKQEFLGKNAKISKYDLYEDITTGEINIYLKGGLGKGVPTGYFIK